MDGGMENMLGTYLHETNSLLDQLDGMLIANEKIGDFSSDDMSEIFRIMHTVEGFSAMIEFGFLSTIAHRIEDLFFCIRDKGIESLNPEHKSAFFNLTFRSEDYLRGGVSKVEGGAPLLDHVESFGRETNGFLKKISDLSQDTPPSSDQDPGAAAAIGDTKDGTAPLPKDPSVLFYLHIFLNDGVGTENFRAFMIVNSLKKCEVDFRYYPGDMDGNPETCQGITDNGFFLTLDSKGMTSHAEKLIKSQNHIHSYELVNNPASVPGLEEAPEGQSLPLDVPAPDSAPMAKAASPAALASQQVHTPVKQSLVNVNLMKLDSLMDIVGEIVITESVVTSAPEFQLLPRDSFDNFIKSSRQLRKLTDGLQDIVISLRMMSISGVFQKMNRIVRGTNQKLSKDMRLTIIGEDTEVDKTIADSIQDPIMHLVRNSMNHGIGETAQERIDVGKEGQDEIILSTPHTSSEVVVSVPDDGCGMPPGKLLARAREKGLLTEPESKYSRKETLGLTMLPGFSTSQAVTEYSDRDVGMDVIKRDVESTGDTISISNGDGKGIAVTTNIPLILTVVDGTKVAVGNSVLTTLISNIRQSSKVDARQAVLDEHRNETVKRMEHFCPIVCLHSFYNLEAEITSVEDGILMWVEASDRPCCLFVDDLVGEQQVVVKPLPVFLDSLDLKSDDIAGCTILGDGNISIMLDIAGFYTTTIESV